MLSWCRCGSVLSGTPVMPRWITVVPFISTNENIHFPIKSAVEGAEGPVEELGASPYHDTSNNGNKSKNIFALHADSFWKQVGKGLMTSRR